MCTTSLVRGVLLAKVGSWTAAADPVMTLGKFEDPPEDELEGDGVSASDHVLAPWAHGLERLA